MAKFILDGQEYGGSASGSKIVKLTQAEYDALPNDKLSDDIVYLITDSGELTAENLFYDGSVTGLGNTVQEAIDEQNKKIPFSVAFSGTTDANGNIKIDGYDWENGYMLLYAYVNNQEGLVVECFHGATPNYVHLKEYTGTIYANKSVSGIAYLIK